MAWLILLNGRNRSYQDNALGGVETPGVELELISPCYSFDLIFPSSKSLKVSPVNVSSAIFLLPIVNISSCSLYFSSIQRRRKHILHI